MKKDIEQFIDKFKKFNLSKEDLDTVSSNVKIMEFKKGDDVIVNKNGCQGFIYVLKGNLRAYAISTTGKEITVFNLNSGDECILCANCMTDNLQLELNLQANKDTKILLLHSSYFSVLKDKYPSIASFVVELLSIRLVSAIKVMTQALFTPITQRIIDFLKQNATNNQIQITHEILASHLGTAREVVSRILKDMEKENLIKLERGKIIILNL